MERRALLRLITLTSAALVDLPGDAPVDLERAALVGAESRVLDAATVDEYDRLTGQLWTAFSRAEDKTQVAPLVRGHVSIVENGLRQPQRDDVRRRLCGSLASLLQLSGEVSFDANRYADAAHCYTLATIAARDARAYDLWACAFIRHAFISLYEDDFREAAPLLDAAVRIAGHGDSTVSTRFWAQSVLAQALAGLGRLDSCQRALGAAGGVAGLTGPAQNGGWLRFTGARLDEERGRCLVQLGRPDLAEPALERALGTALSVRRRGGVLVDLAQVGILRGDVHQVVHYGGAALDNAHRSGSGVIRRRLAGLRRDLGPLRADSHIRHLDHQLASITSSTS